MSLGLTKAYLFNDADEYAFDEDFIEFLADRARLKPTEEEAEYTQDFASSTGFTYDADLVEFVGGVLRQMSKRPNGARLGITFTSSINPNWDYPGNPLTGTANNGASVSGGRLDLTGGGSKSVDYDATGRIGTQVGAIRLKWTPNYNGVPTDTQNFFEIAESEGSGNSRIQLMHHGNSSLFLLVNDENGSNIYSNSLLTFNAVAGTESVIEVAWDLTGGGKFYVFGNGFLLAELDGTFTRSDCAFLRIGGSDGPTNSYFDDVLTFDSVPHTATHDATYSVPESIYLESAVTLPEFEHVGFGGVREFLDFETTEANAPRYSIKLSDGSFLYWNGSGWVASNGSFAQASPLATVVANLASLPVNEDATFQLKVHFSTSNILQEVDEVTFTVSESVSVPVGTQKITPEANFQAGELTSFSHSVVEPTGTSVRYTLEIDSQEKYWNGAFFEDSNGTLLETNTKQEIEDNILQALDHQAYVKLIVYLTTTDEFQSPQIISGTLIYDEDVNGARGFLDSILAFIDCESLTDEEFESIEVEEPAYDRETYLALRAVLEGRNNVDNSVQRLQQFFLAKGVDVSATPGIPTPTSNIFIGGAL